MKRVDVSVVTLRQGITSSFLVSMDTPPRTQSDGRVVEYRVSIGSVGLGLGLVLGLGFGLVSVVRICRRSLRLQCHDNKMTSEQPTQY